jgi:hypothetical protein
VDRDGSEKVSQIASVTLAPVQSALGLSQNYPNPFNPSTTIPFILRSSQAISLIVYNSMGQEVVRLYDGTFLDAGRHTIQFDAGGLPSGIYFYRLIGNNESLHKTMMVTR